jgi:hypothetical protein
MKERRKTFLDKYNWFCPCCNLWFKELGIPIVLCVIPDKDEFCKMAEEKRRFTIPVIREIELVQVSNAVFYMTECPSLHGEVIRIIRAEGVQLWHFNLVTYLELLFVWNSEELHGFVDKEYCGQRNTDSSGQCRLSCDIWATGFQVMPRVCIWQRQHDGRKSNWTAPLKQNCTQHALMNSLRRTDM